MHKKFWGGGNICIHCSSSTCNCYKGVPIRRHTCAPLGFQLVSWRSFKHAWLPPFSPHTSSAPHITFCEMEFEDLKSMNSRKHPPIYQSFVVATDQPEKKILNNQSNTGLKEVWKEQAQKRQLSRGPQGPCQRTTEFLLITMDRIISVGCFQPFYHPALNSYSWEKLIDLDIRGTHQPHSERRAH